MPGTRRPRPVPPRRGQSAPVSPKEQARRDEQDARLAHVKANGYGPPPGFEVTATSSNNGDGKPGDGYESRPPAVFGGAASKERPGHDNLSGMDGSSLGPLTPAEATKGDPVDDLLLDETTAPKSVNEELKEAFGRYFEDVKDPAARDRLRALVAKVGVQKQKNEQGARGSVRIWRRAKKLRKSTQELRDGLRDAVEGLENFAKVRVELEVFAGIANRQEAHAAAVNRRRRPEMARRPSRLEHTVRKVWGKKKVRWGIPVGVAVVATGLAVGASIASGGTAPLIAVGVIAGKKALVSASVGTMMSGGFNVLRGTRDARRSRARRNTAEQVRERLISQVDWEDWDPVTAKMYEARERMRIAYTQRGERGARSYFGHTASDPVLNMVQKRVLGSVDERSKASGLKGPEGSDSAYERMDQIWKDFMGGAKSTATANRLERRSARYNKIGRRMAQSALRAALMGGSSRALIAADWASPVFDPVANFVQHPVEHLADAGEHLGMHTGVHHGGGTEAAPAHPGTGGEVPKIDLDANDLQGVREGVAHDWLTQNGGGQGSNLPELGGNFDTVRQGWETATHEGAAQFDGSAPLWDNLEAAGFSKGEIANMFANSDHTSTLDIFQQHGIDVHMGGDAHMVDGHMEVTGDHFWVQDMTPQQDTWFVDGDGKVLGYFQGGKSLDPSQTALAMKLANQNGVQMLDVDGMSSNLAHDLTTVTNDSVQHAVDSSAHDFGDDLANTGSGANDAAIEGIVEAVANGRGIPLIDLPDSALDTMAHALANATPSGYSLESGMHPDFQYYQELLHHMTEEADAN
jgi:hypothetical protein